MMMPSWSRSHCTAEPVTAIEPSRAYTGGCVAELVGDGREQSRRRAHDLGAGVEQHEVARAVGVLRLAGGEAHLADRGGVLVAEVAAHRHRAAERTGGAGDAVRVGRRARADRRQHRTRDVEQRQQLVVPVERASRSISIVRLALVGSVTCTPPSTPPVRCQITQLSVVPNTASPRSAAARTPSTLSRIHWILPPEKYVAGGSPARLRIEVAASVALEGGGDAVGAGVLPHDGVVQRTSGASVPHDRGLALVGDADGGEVVRARVRRGSTRRGPRCRVRSQISIGSCSTHPASGRICSCSS